MKPNKTILKKMCCEDDSLMNLPGNDKEISRRFCA
jgi:hypothetical protein